MPAAPRPRFFEDAAALRDWLARHHATETELLVGFWKTGTGKPSVTWAEVVDESLCFGWIDGVRKGLDDERWTIRLTPRRPGSTWSARNVARIEELERTGRMQPAGRAAFTARRPERTGTYSYESLKEAVLAPEYGKRLRADKAAWAYFQARPASYRQAAVHWVMSAKRDETRASRLERLVADSAAGRTVPPLTARKRD